MPTPEHEQFEVYLKQFRPLVPEPLPTAARAQPSRRSSVRILWIAGAAAVLILGAVRLQVRSNRPAVPQTAKTASVDPLRLVPRLTMQSANAVLATAPSFKNAFDDLAFRSATVAPPNGK